MTPHQQQAISELPAVDPDHEDALRGLECQGYVNSLQLGGHMLWWVTDKGKAAL